MRRFEDMKSAIEVLSKGKNKIIYDDIDAPSVMVVIEKDTSANVGASSSTDTHPAFILDGTTLDKVYMSKFINIVANNRAYSLPYEDPRANITWDTADAVCRAKGANWGLTPNALWAFVAHRSRKNGTMPRGSNNNRGGDNYVPSETAESVDPTRTAHGRTYTGSGPDTWNDDHTPFGITDLNGNVTEWVGGVRQVKGEINVIPYANCITTSTDNMSASGAAWKAINVAGNFINPGTEGALKYDIVSGKLTLGVTAPVTTTDGGWYLWKNAVTKTDAVTAGAELNYMIDMALYPTGTLDDYLGMGLWLSPTRTETMCDRGGHWDYGAFAGVFYAFFGDARSFSGYNFGFRSVYYGTL